MGATPPPTPAEHAEGTPPPERGAVQTVLAHPAPGGDAPAASSEQLQRVEIIGMSPLTALSDKAVGSRVVDKMRFLDILAKAICRHDGSQDRVSGQHTIVLPPEVLPFVSSGVGRRTDNPDDYVLRVYRGQVGPYLKRDFALPVENCVVTVYTREAYLIDPEVAGDGIEKRYIAEHPEATHILVSVRASAGPETPLTPHRLVSNLGGGNNEALEWSADEIRGIARQSKDYWNQWALVAD